MATNLPIDKRRSALVTTRILWGAVLAGLLIFLTVISVIISEGKPANTDPDTLRMMFYISIGLTLTVIPAGLFIRAQVYKRGWTGHTLSPSAYITGNIMFYAVCEAAAFFSLIVTLLWKAFFPAAVPAVVLLAVLVINFPNGRILFDESPFGGTERS